MPSSTRTCPLAPFRTLHLGCRTLRLAVMVIASFSIASAQSDRDVRSYLDAVMRLQSQGDLNSLERFVSTAPDGSLRNDALEWLAWREWRTGALTKAAHWSDELLAGNPQNAVGLAILASRSNLPNASPQQSWADDPVLVAQRALRNLNSLRQPYDMADAVFRNMKQDLAANLSATVGDDYFRRKDYGAAQPYLRQYLALNPDDPARLYSLAIADLYGPSPDEAEGFRALARVVNLSQATVAAQQMVEFARRKYKERGGSDADWDRYLQATTARGSVQIAATTPASIPAPSPSVPPAPSTTSGAATKPAMAASKPQLATSKATTTALAGAPADYDIPSHSEDMNVPYPTRIPTATGAPMSLGILIETSKTAPGNRRAVINNLSDMVRHLRDDDEAFLVSFSNNVVFEEDLTSDPRYIEKAMDKIKPRQGAALLDAIAFASGHLRRIGKNSRKILLVISDGSDRSAQYSSSEALSSISSSGVEIYCIGMGSDNQVDEARLKALARRTGGQAVFIGGARQFRTATREVALDMGIRLY